MRVWVAMYLEQGVGHSYVIGVSLTAEQAVDLCRKDLRISGSALTLQLHSEEHEYETWFNVANPGFQHMIYVVKAFNLENPDG